MFVKKMAVAYRKTKPTYEEVTESCMEMNIFPTEMEFCEVGDSEIIPGLTFLTLEKMVKSNGIWTGIFTVALDGPTIHIFEGPNRSSWWGMYLVVKKEESFIIAYDEQIGWLRWIKWYIKMMFKR